MKFNLSPIEVSFIVGVVSGLVLTMPIGPLNLTILNEAGRSGFKKGILIGFGATLMELIYCSIAFTSLASFVIDPFVSSFLELCSLVFLVYLGWRFLRTSSISTAAELGKTDRALDMRWRKHVEAKWHPHTAFALGVWRVLANPAVLVFWVVLTANFVSRGWVDPTSIRSILACLIGIGLSTQGWYTFLSWLVSIKHRSLSEFALLRLAKVTGVVLLLLAIVHAVTLAWTIAKSRGHRFQGGRAGHLQVMHMDHR